MASATLVAGPPPLDVSATAQQQAGILFSSLESWLSSAPALALPLHRIEPQQELTGRQVQRLLLQDHVRRRGTGDVGPALLVTQTTRCTLYTHRRLQRRTLKTIFGPIEIDRVGYSHHGQSSIHPLDEAMQLPARSFSYELQKRLVKAAVQGPFRESTERIRDTTGLTVPLHSLEHLLPEAAQDFDAFYTQRPVEPSSAAASILVVAVDCKGIPLVQPPHHQRSVQVTKQAATRGPRPGCKKMATVAAVFTRHVRTPAQVVESLFHTETKPTATQPHPPRPENKRVWASLMKTKAAVVDQAVEEVHRRDPDAGFIRVALTDGERALQILVSRKLKVLLILDLLHVLEKVWKAAHVFHPEDSPDAELYARLMTLRILEGKVAQVVKGLRQTVTKRKLFGSKRKTLLNVAAYFHRNRNRMRYHEYLAQGLPIATGPVEGACKNLIKDRMERSGLRWTQLMAEALIKLRALYLSEDFDAYWDFHIREEQPRLYPSGRWAVVVK
jgi:hypothetical protein